MTALFDFGCTYLWREQHEYAALKYFGNIILKSIFLVFRQWN
jgi:hypothetical protein